jgi:hypothetical protein
MWTYTYQVNPNTDDPLASITQKIGLNGKRYSDVVKVTGLNSETDSLPIQSMVFYDVTNADPEMISESYGGVFGIGPFS